MRLDELRKLLESDEGVALEFKREWYKLDAQDGVVKRNQRGEFIRDVLSLANGNTRVAGETAHLVIGVDDVRNGAGHRVVLGVGNLKVDRSSLLKMVRQASDPPLEDLYCEHHELDGHHLLLLVIPPSLHLYETTSELDTPHHKYDRHLVFIRQGSDIKIASRKEREAISRMKLHYFTESRKVAPPLISLVVGAIVGAALVASVGERITGNPAGSVVGLLVGVFIGGFLGVAIGNIVLTLVQIRSDWRYLTPAKRLVLAMTVIGILLALAYYFGR